MNLLYSLQAKRLQRHPPRYPTSSDHPWWFGTIQVIRRKSQSPSVGDTACITRPSHADPELMGLHYGLPLFLQGRFRHIGYSLTSCPTAMLSILFFAIISDSISP